MTEKTIDNVIARDSIAIPDNVNEMLKSVDSWYFNIFDFNNATKNEPLKYIGHHFFNLYDLYRKFSIRPAIFNNFITTLEAGYKKYNNPFHNNIHAADVTQTIMALLIESKIIDWLTDLEKLTVVLAALIHDYDHDGKTNGFHIAIGSEMALLYNDRSVQENHTLSATFLLLREDKYNFLSNLSRENHRQLRSLLIDLVLSTDIAFHFTISRDVKRKLSSLKLPSKLKVLAMFLHAADISNQFKKYPLNVKWTDLISEEFFAQGDRERELNMPISPHCDRCLTCIPETQLNFMDFIVHPTFMILVSIENLINSTAEQNDEDYIQKPWFKCYQENKMKWHDEVLKGVPSELVQRQSI